MSVENAARALTAVTQLPDFQMTPASQKRMMDLRLAAKSRIALARHERTSRCTFKVAADTGVLTVAYLPQDIRYAQFIPEALAAVEGAREIRATMATTSILWIQERFDSTCEAFQEVVELATKWNAAVELVSLAHRMAGEADAPSSPSPVPEPVKAEQYNGGIEDDVDGVAPDDGGVRSTLGELAAAGRSGGGKVIRGGAQDLLESLDPSSRYTLVIVGDLFLEKGHAARVRMTRELQRLVGEHITAPVVDTNELKSQYLFGRRDVAKLAGFLTLVAVVYFVVFSHQQTTLKFLSGQWWGGSPMAKVLVAATVFVFIPFVAHCYGAVAKSLMKLVKME
jgi:hypothetical protein